MKSDRNILIAFILNLSFSIFEFIGGAFTGSVAIASDALHDLGDAASIGVAYFMERKSKTAADKMHPFGHGRYSVIGGLFTALVLLLGSMAVLISAAERIRNPVEVNYNGMIIFAIIGVIVNFIAAYVTKDGASVNQKAVNLHMLEDVMGWIAVLIGAIVMYFTDWYLIDAILSVAVALTILISATTHTKEIIHILTEGTPTELNVDAIQTQLNGIDEVDELISLKIWNINADEPYALLHIQTNHHKDAKQKVREILAEYGITNCTIECNDTDEITPIFATTRKSSCNCGHHHHHFPKILLKKQ